MFFASVSFAQDDLLSLLDSTGKKPEVKQQTKDNTVQVQDLTKNKLVRFLQSVPQFLGEDLNTYGPYEAEDIANLPMRVSEVLIKNKRAEEI